jgi:uncharacterized protein YukE
MIIKVSHNEITDIKNTLNKDRSDFDVEIDKMLDQMERLKEIWSGYDASIFFEKAYEYISNMKKITNTMGSIATFSEKANGGFIEVDESFSKKLEEEAQKYDESDYIEQPNE